MIKKKQKAVFRRFFVCLGAVDKVGLTQVLGIVKMIKGVENSMKNNPNTKQEERNIRIYKLYKKGAYTMRGLANLFRLSTPRIFEIIKKMKSTENK